MSPFDFAQDDADIFMPRVCHAMSLTTLSPSRREDRLLAVTTSYVSAFGSQQPSQATFADNALRIFSCWKLFAQSVNISVQDSCHSNTCSAFVIRDASRGTFTGSQTRNVVRPGWLSNSILP